MSGVSVCCKDVNRRFVFVALLLLSGCQGSIVTLDGGDGADAGPAARPDASAAIRDAGLFYDAGPTLDLFVATGHMGRSIVSGDDGRSWVADESDLDAFRCFRANGNPDGGSADCDHNEATCHPSKLQ